MIANEIINFIVEFINRFMDFHDFATGMIAIIAVSSFIYFTLLNSKMSKSLISLTKSVESLKGTPDERIRELNEIINKCDNEHIKSLWIKYYDTLLEYAGEGNAIVDITTYFNKVTLVDIPTKRKVAEIMPGILIACGILGTFTGLVVGLNAIDVKDAEAIQQSMIPLMQGLKVGFLTSVLGIGTSLVWNFFDRMLLHKIVKHVNAFQTAYERKFPPESFNNIFVEMLKLQSEQTKAVEQMKSNLSSEQTGQTKRVAEEGIFSKLAESIANSIEKSMQPVSQGISELNEALTSLSAVKEQPIVTYNPETGQQEISFEAMEAHFERQEDIFEKLLKQQEKSNEQIIGILSELLKAFKDEAAAREESNEKISSTLENMGEMTKKLQQQVENDVGASVKQLQENMHTRISDLSDKVGQDVKDIIDEELKKITIGIDQKVDEIDQTVKTIDNKLEDRVVYPTKTKSVDGDFL